MHEFSAVIIVSGALAQLRLLFPSQLNTTRIAHFLPEEIFFPADDIARACALQILAGGNTDNVQQQLSDPRLSKRAHYVSAWSRLQRQDNLDERAHASLWAARALAGLLEPNEQRAFLAESQRRLCGVPDSEPTWVRPLDGMLATLALQKLGSSPHTERWRTIFETRFALRRGRRPAAIHTPSMFSLGRARSWEHAAATALAFSEGWIDDEDWTVLRAHCLGVASSNYKDPQRLRFIAAGKFWAALTNDEEALRILSRRQTSDELVSRALTECAESVLKSGDLANK